jgi:hypothetical protein
MKNRFRPQDFSKSYIMKQRLTYGRTDNFNWQTRINWNPAGWKINQISIGRRFSQLHYLACHSPKPIAKKWQPAYTRFCNTHFADRGNASIRFLNTWTAHSWL